MNDLQKQEIYIQNTIELLAKELNIEEKKVAEIFKEGIMYDIKMDNCTEKFNATKILRNIIYSK